MGLYVTYVAPRTADSNDLMFGSHNVLTAGCDFLILPGAPVVPTFCQVTRDGWNVAVHSNFTMIYGTYNIL